MTRSCSRSGRAVKAVPGRQRSRSRAIVSASTSSAACRRTAPRPSQTRRPSASCSASLWRQSTFTTMFSSSPMVGATHAVCPPGRKGCPSRIDHADSRYSMVSRSVVSQLCRPSRSAAATRFSGRSSSSGNVMGPRACSQRPRARRTPGRRLMNLQQRSSARGAGRRAATAHSRRARPAPGARWGSPRAPGSPRTRFAPPRDARRRTSPSRRRPPRCASPIAVRRKPRAPAMRGRRPLEHGAGRG